MTDPTFQPDISSRIESHNELIKSSSEVLSSAHDILGKEYEFNGVSFVVLGMQPLFSDTDDDQNGLQLGVVIIADVKGQRVPVIPFQGGIACITKIQIGDEVIVGSAEILKYITVVEYAPAGWMMSSMLASELEIGIHKIESIKKSYRQSNPDWFQEFRVKNGRSYEHLSPVLCEIIRNEIEKIERAPEKWITVTNLANELSVSVPLIANRVNPYRKSHPEWFCEYYARGDNEAHEHFSPELCDLIRNGISEKRIIPDLWKTKDSLAEETGVSTQVISRRANLCREQHPEWFRIYIAPTGHKREHYSSEFCDIIRSINVTLERAPERWLTKARLAEELKVSDEFIMSRIDSYRQSNPDWFQEFRVKNGRSYEHLSPVLCDIIRNEIKRIEEAPAEWMTRNKLAKYLDVNSWTLSRISERYRQTNPEWFREYQTQGGVAEHFSPELCDIIKESIDHKGNKDVIPQEWLTRNRLAKELNVDPGTISHILNRYRQTNPEWFRDDTIQNGHICEHLSPELCTIIRDTINAMQFAPDNWNLNGKLANELNVAYLTVKRCADEYRQTHPEWFREYSSTNNIIREHYAPELCDIIRDRLNNIEQAPAKWKTKGTLVMELQSTDKMISQISDQYRQLNPDWFQEFKVPGGQNREHFSPELCSLVRDQIAKRVYAPDQWKTARHLKDELQKNWSTIKNIAEMYRLTHPEWFREYSSKNNIIREYYAPELCDIIRNEINKIEHAPDKWMTMTNLMQELQSSIKTISLISDLYRLTHPEWFCEYHAQDNKPHEHFSPELCDIIRDEIRKYEFAPDNWKTKSYLANELCIDKKIVFQFMEKYRSSHPEWFCEYKAVTGKRCEHYAPELCDLIREKLKNM